MKKKSLRRAGVVTPTRLDTRKWVEEDDHGIVAMAHAEGLEAHFESSKLQVRFGTGTRGPVLHMFSGEVPGRIRNQNLDGAIADEVREWQALEECLSNLDFALRQGRDPRIAMATTPPGAIGERRVSAAVQATNQRVLRELEKEERVCVVTGSTLENLPNLSPTFKRNVIDRHKGTLRGRLEIEGKYIIEIPGAVLTEEVLNASRMRRSDMPELGQRLVGVDPSGSWKLRNAETGIIAGGRAIPGPDKELHGYCTHDWSGHHTPERWARLSSGLYHRTGAERILAEKNYGGDLVKSNLRTFDKGATVRLITAMRGKHVRADPVLQLIERGYIHIIGHLPKLELQLLGFTLDGYEGEGSPDHADAFVYVMQELLVARTGREGYAVH